VLYCVQGRSKGEEADLPKAKTKKNATPNLERRLN